jgi:hypothetical protein
MCVDCAMIVHPDFLQNILGHLYKQVGPQAVTLFVASNLG